MQLSTFFVTLLASAVVANPAKRGYDGDNFAPCAPGLYSSPQCCATDVLGVADLDCATVSKAPSSPDDFKAICAAGGQRARCCVLPVLGQDVLCQTPVGV
ncbi:cerato-ulmin [Jackrogersella minutella]|nr:cerato-ulmin [Jackrogersella minutella]